VRSVRVMKKQPIRGRRICDVEKHEIYSWFGIGCWWFYLLMRGNRAKLRTIYIGLLYLWINVCRALRVNRHVIRYRGLVFGIWMRSWERFAAIFLSRFWMIYHFCQTTPLRLHGCIVRGKLWLSINMISDQFLYAKVFVVLIIRSIDIRVW
jgi:hypothetical protein